MSGEALAKTTETNGLVPVSNFNLMTIEEGIVDQEAWNTETDGLTINFDKVKIPSGGSLVFKVPNPNSDSGKPDNKEELIGVILDHYPVNAYWKSKYNGENNPPDCSSTDGKMGTGTPGGNCKMCPMNQWGSADDGTNGKACKNMHRVYLLGEGELIPIQLTIPPTSLKNLSDYLVKRVLAKGRRSYGVVTKVSLKEAKSGGGIDYSQAVFSLIETLNPVKTAQAADLARNLKPIMRSQAITQDEYNTVSSNDPLGDDPF